LIDSTKNYEFGASALSVNPITNPGNSYQFNYSKYKQPGLNSNGSNPNSNPHSIPSQPVMINGNNRGIASARLRALGNNIVNK
jgi:hypothetical protein